MNEVFNKVKSLCSSDAALVMGEMYESAYGIYDHTKIDPNRPLISVAFHEAEDTLATSALYEQINRFADLKIFKYFGISLTEYLDLPTYVCTELNRICTRRIREEGNIASDVLADLEK